MLGLGADAIGDATQLLEPALPSLMQAMISGARFEISPFTPALLRYPDVIMADGVLRSGRQRDATSRDGLRQADFAPRAVTSMLAAGYKQPTI